MSKSISDLTGKSLTMESKTQPLKPIVFGYNADQMGFQKEEEFFSTWSQAEVAKSTGSIARGLVSAAKSSAMWYKWKRRRRCHCMPSDCRGILIPFKYPFFSVSSFSCCFLSTFSSYTQYLIVLITCQVSNSVSHHRYMMISHWWSFLISLSVCYLGVFLSC